AKMPRARKVFAVWNWLPRSPVNRFMLRWAIRSRSGVNPQPRMAIRCRWHTWQRRSIEKGEAVTDHPFASVVDVIGGTPLVELSRITRNLDGRIFAKLEYLNPGFSKKDRIARQMIEEAEVDGRLSPGQTVVELTSGNTGTGLAIVCAVKGYPFVAVMSKGNSVERARMMRALGAEVVLVDQLPGSTPGQVSGGDLERVEQEARRIVRERGAFRADQFNLLGNFRAHFQHTAPEILAQSEGKIDAF